MTAETLKPFITPQNVQSIPTVHSSVAIKRRQKGIIFFAIGISTITLLLLALASGYTVWLSMRVSQSENDIIKLNRAIENLKTRLGISNIDEVPGETADFDKQHIIDQATYDDIEGDYDEDDVDDIEDEDDKDNSKLSKESDYDDDDEDYEEQIAEYLKRFNNSDDDDDEAGGVTDDNLFDDFEKYQGSQKKNKNSSRTTRSISHASHEATQEIRLRSTSTEDDQSQVSDLSSTTKRPQHHLRLDTITKDGSHRRRFVSEDHMESKHRSPLRHRSHRRHKFPMTKSAKYTAQVSPMINDAAIKPAAHFHLHRKIPNRDSTIKVNSFTGDMYIGHHPSWSNEVATEHYFQVENGVLTVREPGLYYVYAQICYNNSFDQNGFVIFHGHTPFLQCLNTVPTNLPMKIHTCHTSGLIYLRENETIHLRDIHTDRNVVLREANNRSYFGLIKV